MKKLMRSMTAAFFTATLGSTFDWVTPVTAGLPLRRPVRIRGGSGKHTTTQGDVPRSSSDPAS